MCWDNSDTLELEGFVQSKHFPELITIHQDTKPRLYLVTIRISEEFTAPVFRVPNKQTWIWVQQISLRCWHVYQTTRSHITDNSNSHSRRSKNIKFRSLSNSLIMRIQKEIFNFDQREMYVMRAR
jgi:hypothetical protein